MFICMANFIKCNILFISKSEIIIEYYVKLNYTNGPNDFNNSIEQGMVYSTNQITPDYIRHVKFYPQAMKMYAVKCTIIKSAHKWSYKLRPTTEFFNGIHSPPFEAFLYSTFCLSM